MKERTESGRKEEGKGEEGGVYACVWEYGSVGASVGIGKEGVKESASRYELLTFSLRLSPNLHLGI